MVSWIFGRTFIFSKVLLPEGCTRLLRKTYTRFLVGSAQVLVPVKPVCPKVLADADKVG